MHKVILIGSSTGGPGLLEKIIKNLPEHICTPIIIAQHMDALSLHSFSARLHRLGKTPVKFVDTQTTLKTNEIYVLKDTTKLTLKNNQLTLEPINKVGYLYHPTIDELFISASGLSNVKITAYILSGIGADGAFGMQALHTKGALTIAQDEETSIVYGMPRAAKERNAVQEILSIDDIKNKIAKDVEC